MKRPLSTLVGATLLVVVVSVALPSASLASPTHSGSNLSVVGYSTPASVYGDQNTKGTLEYAFAHTTAGQGATFTNSFAASDSQTQAVENGLPADVVNLSYAPNVNSLKKAGLVPNDWFNNRHHGMVTDSVVAFGVRPHNPKRIRTWSDLIGQGVKVLNPDPRSSGGAHWNWLAAYGAKIVKGRTNAQAVAYLKRLFKHIEVQDTSASHELSTFLNGTGDVMIGYEDDIMNAALAYPGKIHLVVPPQSLLIENPLAWTQGAVSHNQLLAKKFVHFLYTPAAQRIWAKNNYWPVVTRVASHYHFPKPRKLFTVHSLGGWPKLNNKFFGTNGIVTKIENGG